MQYPSLHDRVMSIISKPSSDRHLLENTGVRGPGFDTHMFARAPYALCWKAASARSKFSAERAEVRSGRATERAGLQPCPRVSPAQAADEGGRGGGEDGGANGSRDGGLDLSRALHVWAGTAASRAQAPMPDGRELRLRRLGMQVFARQHGRGDCLVKAIRCCSRTVALPELLPREPAAHLLV